MKKGRVADVATGLMVICALTVMGLAVRRQWHPSAASAEAPKVRSMDSLLTTGHVIGNADAATKVVEFADYQCPFCARAQEQMDSIIVRSHGHVALVFHHYPMQNLHARAMSAAVASECAADQGAFSSFHHALFAHPEDIGTRPWASFVSPATVWDTLRFRRCQDAPQARDRVAADMRLADRLGVRATPAFVVNGRLYHGLLPRDVIDALSLEKVAVRAP